MSARTIAADISKDTRLCMSLAARPSNIGTRFHNYLYDLLDLDFVYKAFTTTDIAAAIAGVRALGVRGCAISMPWKEAVIPLVDELHPSAASIESVNTIVNDDGVLSAYNTDYIAVASLLRTHEVPTSSRFVVLGSGGMAKAAVAALRDGGFTDGVVVARNEQTGPELAERYGFTWSQALPDESPELILNATPIGMAGGPAAADSPVPHQLIRTAHTVFDVVAAPPHTPLIEQAQAAGVATITGAEVIALQATEQFVRYTGVRPTPEQIRIASEYSRATPEPEVLAGGRGPAR